MKAKYSIERDGGHWWVTREGQRIEQCSTLWKAMKVQHGRQKWNTYK